jgi:tetratricopeptide (TPR) repeat protein
MLHTQSAVLFVTFLCTLFLGQADAQVRLSSEEAEKLIERSDPVYPEIAKVARAKGLVRVEAIVSEEGQVTSAKAISGHPLLQTSAQNVKRQKYKAHIVGGKQVSFITVVDVVFPPGSLTSAQKEEQIRQEQLASQYFEEKRKCSDLTKGQKWKEAEAMCRTAVQIADRLSEDRSLEKMGANELLGYVLVGQKRYPEAIAYYNRALNVVGLRLTEEDAELGRLYGHLAIAHHLMRDLDKARELYKKAEMIYQLAHATIGRGDSDEWGNRMKQQYMTSLRKLLEYHLMAAEDAGATSEAEEIRSLMKNLP